MERNRLDEIRKEIIKARKKIKKDGWTNALTGIGKERDKKTKTYFGDYVFLDDDELARVYLGEGLGARIINGYADDMTRKWVELEGEKAEEIGEVLNHIGVEGKFNEAIKWQRLFGGSIIIVGAMDGEDIQDPLNFNRLKSVEWLRVVDRSDIVIELSEFDMDSSSPDFGKVVRYYVENPVREANGLSTRAKPGGNVMSHLLVHRSRVLEFFGAPAPKRIIADHNDIRYWGSSALQAPWEQLRDMGSVTGGVATLMNELIVSIYKFSNLADMLDAGNEKKLVDRMNIIDMSKSIINAVLLDSEEEFHRESAALGGVADILDRFMIFLAAATEYPVTKLFGRSPAGENATGEGDMNNYYDSVATKQKNYIKPALLKLLDIISASLKVKPPTFKFKPLKQMTEKEESEINKAKAETFSAYANADKVYMESGVLLADEVEKLRGFDKIEEVEEYES